MTEKAKTFAQRVAAFLKMDDEGKVASFQEQALKITKKQIKAQEEKLVEKQEELAEYINEKSPEIILNVDIDSIKTIKDRQEYFENTYLPMLLSVNNAVDTFEEEIEEIEDKISALKRVVETLS